MEVLRPLKGGKQLTMQPIIRSVNSYGIVLSPLGAEWAGFLVSKEPSKPVPVAKPMSSNQKEIFSIYSEGVGRGGFKTRSTTFWGAGAAKRQAVHVGGSSHNSSYYLEKPSAGMDTFATVEPHEPESGLMRQQSWRAKRIYQRKTRVRSANRSFSQVADSGFPPPATVIKKNPARMHPANSAASKKISFTVIKQLANRNSKRISEAKFCFTDKDKSSILNVNIQA